MVKNLFVQILPFLFYNLKLLLLFHFFHIMVSFCKNFWNHVLLYIFKQLFTFFLCCNFLKKNNNDILCIKLHILHWNSHQLMYMLKILYLLVMRNLFFWLSFFHQIILFVFLMILHFHLKIHLYLFFQIICNLNFQFYLQVIKVLFDKKLQIFFFQ